MSLRVLLALATQAMVRGPVAPTPLKACSKCRFSGPIPDVESVCISTRVQELMYMVRFEKHLSQPTLAGPRAGQDEGAGTLSFR